MARYGDLDSVKLKVQRYLIPNTDIDGTVDVAVAERWFLKLLDEEPTSDVVPKSEVERLEKENTELLVSATTDILVSMEKLVKVRTEHPIFKAIEEKVAREIFEEIGKRLSIVEGHNGLYTISEADLAELKKKYTEENT